MIRTGTQSYGESFILGINNPVVWKEYVRSMYFVRRIEIFIPLLPTLITQFTHFLVFLLKIRVICRKERVKASRDSIDSTGSMLFILAGMFTADLL